MRVRDGYVERTEVAVLRVWTDMGGRGPRETFATLEARPPTLRGRKFYGSFRRTRDGEEYSACVERAASDDPGRMGLEEGVLPGGLYIRRKLEGSEENIPDLPGHFDELAQDHESDPRRPSLEFYGSERELHSLLPIKGRNS